MFMGDMHEDGVLPRVVKAFRTALQLLGCTTSPRLLEHLGTVVHQAMSDQGRFYHHTEHVFSLFKDASDDPIATLAALFHDTVCFFSAVMRAFRLTVTGLHTGGQGASRCGCRSAWAAGDHQALGALGGVLRDGV
jgi:hypothetical protein